MKRRFKKTIGNLKWNEKGEMGWFKGFINGESVTIFRPKEGQETWFVQAEIDLWEDTRPQHQDEGPSL